MLLEPALLLGLIHVLIPLAYYGYMRSIARTPWDIFPIEGNMSSLPSMTLIIPTYNEEDLIIRRLENLAALDYPKDLLEVLIVDSASTDKTVEKVLKWMEENHHMNVHLITESKRKGKVSALNLGLKNADHEIIVIGDVDAFWKEDALKKVAKWIKLESVGAVSCMKVPVGGPSLEVSYRGYYNVLRIGESKIHSTPIFHGELAAFERDLLIKVGGFMENIGADDSNAATRIALSGKRAIIVDDIICEELVPPGRMYKSWKLRRAQHLIQHFWWSLTRIKPTTKFGKILMLEAYLHLFNPWILLTAGALLLLSTIIEPPTIPLLIWLLSILALAVKEWRLWLNHQIQLVIAAIRNLKTKELVWEKQSKG